MLLSSFDCLVWTATDTIYPFRGNIEDALQKIQVCFTHFSSLSGSNLQRLHVIVLP